MRKVAFLVANDTFPEDPSIPPLRFTQNDASELGKILADHETCAFETKLYLNATSQKVLADLEQISEELEADDTLLFYYAGHGKLRRDGQLCLASSDTTMAQLGARSIRAREVLAYLQESHARRRLLILDCCQSGAIGREFRGNDLQSSLAGLADSFGSYILTASTAIQLAEEREKDGHGVFTKALIDCLTDGGKEIITVNDWYEYAYKQLRALANQTPLKWGLEEQGPSFEIGNFKAKRERERQQEQERLERERQQEQEQLVSTARARLSPYVALGEVTVAQVAMAISLLKRDEASLFPRDRRYRKDLIRFAKGEASFLEVFARPESVPKSLELPAQLIRGKVVPPWLIWATVGLFGTLAVILLGSYFYLHSTNKAELPQPEASSTLNLPSASPSLTTTAPSALNAGQEKEMAAKPGSEFTDCASCPAMIVVPARKFIMGSPKNEPGREASEGPQREVRIAKPFAVSKYEVTFAEWDACAAASACPHAAANWGRGQMPVINVSWDNAKQYVGWLSRLTGKEYRLLTEAKWEYAARAGSTTRYSWGDDVGKGNANCDGCGSQWDGKQTAPVGSFKPNAFGLYDMAGNVREWVEDIWHDSYKGAPTDGSAWLQGGDASLRAVRGGSWNYNPQVLRAASRDWLATDYRLSDLGFRVGRTLTP
jgi:formylglycine-generating enzyme required for sulfatase activity/uncharacterized caspase-like protein